MTPNAATSVPVAFPNPLLQLHRAIAEAEFQQYEDVEIVSTFGQPQAEYATIRKSAGLFDLPHRGILQVSGKDRLTFLNNLLSNNTWDKNARTGLFAGAGVYAYFLNLRGRIVADVNVLELGDRTLLEMDVRMVAVLRSTFARYLFTEQVTLTSAVGTLHQIALHGPGAFDVLRQASGAAVPALAPLGSAAIRIIDTDITIWRDDVCGVPGLHLIVPIDRAAEVWSHLVTRFGESTELGKRMLRPMGWAAFNTTRIEAGRPLLDIDFPAAAPDRPGMKLTASELEAAEQDRAQASGVLPAETGQATRALSYTKCYIGQEIVARMHARKQVARMLVGIKMDEGFLPVAGAPIFDEKDNQVGVVTSSTLSPVLSNAALALGVVKKPMFTIGTVLHIPAEGAIRPAKVVELPFVLPG